MLLSSGDVPVAGRDKMVYTPLISGWQAHYYTVKLERITINGKNVAVEPVGMSHSWLLGSSLVVSMCDRDGSAVRHPGLMCTLAMSPSLEPVACLRPSPHGSE